MPQSVCLACRNDWQEGTIFEPSKEERFQRLLQLQKSILGFADEEAFDNTLKAFLECHFENEPASWYYWEPQCVMGRTGCDADGSHVECRFRMKPKGVTKRDVQQMAFT